MIEKQRVEKADYNLRIHIIMQKKLHFSISAFEAYDTDIGKNGKINCFSRIIGYL